MPRANAIKMTEAVGEVVRISPGVCRDEAGHYIYTHPNAKHPGVGRGIGGGHPQSFKSGEEFIDSFLSFCNYIIDNDFHNPDTGQIMFPTRSSFARWAGISQRTVYNYVESYFPESKKPWQKALADTLTEGAAAGVYDRTITIFCLKNWCDWADKNENVNTEIKPKLADKETADRLIKEYTDRKSK